MANDCLEIIVRQNIFREKMSHLTQIFEGEQVLGPGRRNRTFVSETDQLVLILIYFANQVKLESD